MALFQTKDTKELQTQGTECQGPDCDKLKQETTWGRGVLTWKWDTYKCIHGCVPFGQYFQELIQMYKPTRWAFLEILLPGTRD